ncbi:Cys/Met metabolism pyridoxal-phosphate-dependent protein [Caldithrix abyssi DSM 13497]|uniref:L-methionine gamma-lyase n=1 Tax=Caldithrix abyssi DSM 13497 TaxID=880073 RepID=H1XNF6_CALAY|nr:methionine-gamma-lyase [Caldithrix abyssi DSM 13497]EHO42127.1 Cys/Met metabolism pyridoxal-phosphate-dependent protein [Caldithrix abyssi DSM 13497]
MSMDKNYSDATKSVHAGMMENEHLAVVPPIYQTSTFKFRDADHGAALFAGQEEGFIYTRMGNPTIQGLENAVAQLENGHKGLACGSGMAAIQTVFSAYLKQGDHVVCSEAVYGPTTTLLEQIFAKFGVETTFVDTSNLQSIERAIKPQTRIVYVETPGNPTLCITDIKGAAELAHQNGALLVVDNTFSSPVLQKPFLLGADIVVHSMTKFLNGHADVVAGMIVTKNEEQFKLLRKTLNLLGGVIGPMNAFLVHRGIKSLAMRMERHCANAQKIAEFLEKHPKVKQVVYPGLPSHPQHELAKRQMSGFGGMISFEVQGGIEGGKALMNNVKLCQLAVSLGGVETLIQHPASMTHAIMPREARLKAHITDGLVRLSVGVEDADELIADLDQALNTI